MGTILTIILGVFITGILTGTFSGHIFFWVDTVEKNILKGEHAILLCTFTLPLFPIFGLLEIIKIIKEVFSNKKNKSSENSYGYFETL